MRAFVLGVFDGLDRPYELISGITWNDQATNEEYDRGVNIGQAIALMRLRATDTLRVVRQGGRAQPVIRP